MKFFTSGIGRALMVAVLCSAAPAIFSQSFTFDDAESYANFDLRAADSTLVCFYRTINGDRENSHYRTIAFDPSLNVIDTASILMPGKCEHIGSGENEKFIWHIFHVKGKGWEVIRFLITDKQGRRVAMWQKNKDDMPVIFGKYVNLSRIGFKIVPSDADFANSNLLVVEPDIYRSGGQLSKRCNWVAFNILDGTVVWKLAKPLSSINAHVVNGKLVVFEMLPGGPVKMHFFNLTNGTETFVTSVNPPKVTRQISAYIFNKNRIIIAGAESESSNKKHSRYFVKCFDFDGKVVYDKLDTAGQGEENRLQMLGGVQLKNGDIELIGEYYKVDPAPMITGIALTAALTILTRTAPQHPGVYGGVTQHINGVAGLRISPEGEVKIFYRFETVKHSDFSVLTATTTYAVLRCRQSIFCYDLSKPETAPAVFGTSVSGPEILPFAENLIRVKKDDIKREIILEKVVQ